MSAWLSIVGIGEDGLDGLTGAARALIETAEVLVGGERHLAFLPDGAAERLTWASPLSQTVEEIAARRGRRVCVLATGDPMSFGIGVTLTRAFAPEEVTVLPALGAFNLACARLGWPRAEVDTLTLHGRPLDTLNLFLAPGARLLMLSEDGGTPAQVAARLVERGYGDSLLSVFEHMGGPEERRFDERADRWGARRTADFNTIAVHCIAGADAVILPRVPGLPDAAFEHDGQLTKRVVRAATIANLRPVPSATLWDVGAGAGSIAIEWLRATRTGRAIAIERSADRCAHMARNAAHLGAPTLDIRHGDAPAALADLPPPDAVFVGGGISTPGLVDRCWQALSSGGRLVANVVTLEGEAVLSDWHGRVGGEMTRLAVSNLEAVGPYHGWRPSMPVTQWAVTKP